MDIDSIKNDFNTDIVNGNTFGLNEKGIKHVNDYFDHLKDTGQDINQLDFTTFMHEVEGIGVNTRIATENFKKFGAYAKSLGANLASGIISGLISWGITALADYIRDLHISAKEAKQALNEFGDEFKSLNSEIAEGKSQLPDLVSRYEELAEGVDLLGNNISLTSDQYNEYKDVVGQISEIMPDLTTYFNEQGQAVGFAGTVFFWNKCE